jgi:serine/threonine protein kinase
MSDMQDITKKQNLVAGGDSMIGKVLLERYQVLEVLGEGGMGVVYKAKHTQLKRIVAIKVVRTTLVSNENTLARFKREAEAASAFDHPALCAVHDYGFTREGLPALVMDYINGESLSDVIKKRGPLPAEEVLRIGRQICSGLAHAHKKGVIHRDLKPSNIMMVQADDGETQAKIVDFGIAKSLQAETQNMTQTGEIFGSPLYMSPEQCMGSQVDGRSDLYSLGCLLFEAVVGRVPLKGDSPISTIAKHMNEVPPRVVPVPNDRDSAILSDVIAKLLEKDPDRRFQSAEEVKYTLAPSKAAAPALSKPEPKKKKTGLLAGVAAVLIAAAVGIGFFGGSVQQSAETPPKSKYQIELETIKAESKGDPQAALKRARPIGEEIARSDQVIAKSGDALGTIYKWEFDSNPNSIDTGRTLALVARSLHHNSKFDEAIRKYKEAFTIVENADAKPAELALIRQWIGNAYFDAGNYADAVEPLAAAALTYDRAKDPQAAELKRIAEAQCAFALEKSGQYKKAVVLYATKVFNSPGVIEPDWQKSYDRAMARAKPSGQHP